MCPARPPGECQSPPFKVLPMLVKQRTMGTTYHPRQSRIGVEWLSTYTLNLHFYGCVYGYLSDSIVFGVF